MIYFILYQIPLLARLIILSILLILSKKLVQISAVSSTNMVGAVVNSWFNFVPFVSFVVNLPKSKTKPKQSQTKPIFRTPIPVFKRISTILDNLRQHFLCKTKPNSVVGIQIPVEYDMSKKVNYATCPAPTLRLFHKVGAVETNPIFSKNQFENKGLTTVSKSR